MHPSFLKKSLSITFHITDGWYGLRPRGNKLPVDSLLTRRPLSALLRISLQRNVLGEQVLKALSSPGCKGRDTHPSVTYHRDDRGPLAQPYLLCPVVRCELLWPPGSHPRVMTVSSRKAIRNMALEYIALINFRPCLRGPRSFPGTIWKYIPMRFWPRTPKHLEIKLPDEFRHFYVPIFGEIWKHNLISTMGQGLCLSIM